MIEKVMIDEFMTKALDTCIELGGRILAALVIFIIGKFIVNWLNRLFAKALEKRKVDASIQSFLKSIVNITLLVLLFLAVIGKLGIELTSFAALLASAGVAIGMALSGNLSNFAGGVIILVFIKRLAINQKVPIHFLIIIMFLRVYCDILLGQHSK